MEKYLQQKTTAFVPAAVAPIRKWGGASGGCYAGSTRWGLTTNNTLQWSTTCRPKWQGPMTCEESGGRTVEIKTGKTTGFTLCVMD